MLIGVHKRFRESIYKCIMKELSKKKLILISEKQLKTITELFHIYNSQPIFEIFIYLIVYVLAWDKGIK